VEAKPNRLFVSEFGKVDARCEGKNAWNEAICYLMPQTLDMSIVEWLKKKP